MICCSLKWVISDLQTITDSRIYLNILLNVLREYLQMYPLKNYFSLEQQVDYPTLQVAITLSVSPHCTVRLCANVTDVSDGQVGNYLTAPVHPNHLASALEVCSKSV